MYLAVNYLSSGAAQLFIYLFIYLFLVKPLDSSLESENDRYEHGGQQESDENDDNDHKDSQKRFENFRKSSFTDFSGLESKLCEFENSRNNSNDVEVENDTEKAFEIITETAGTTKEQQVIENFDDNKTISGEQRECDLTSNNFENKSDNCFDELDNSMKSADHIKMDSNDYDYDYKLTQDVGCHLADPKDDSDSSSSDGEDQTEKKDEEKEYSSSASEGEGPDYQKLPAFDGKEAISAELSKDADVHEDVDDVVYEMKTETAKLELCEDSEEKLTSAELVPSHMVSFFYFPRIILF